MCDLASSDQAGHKHMNYLHCFALRSSD